MLIAINQYIISAYIYKRSLTDNNSTSTESKNDCWGINCPANWIWGRWILFIFFLLPILSLAAIIIRLNALRSRRGQDLIMGTAWFTPPTYRQSERQYGRQGEDFVPPYTEEANENDLGYYDQEGMFHTNSKVHPLSAPPHIREMEQTQLSNNNLDPDIERPQMNDDLELQTLTRPVRAHPRSR